MKSRHLNKKGMSLIELLVYIAIGTLLIGVIMSTLIIVMKTYRQVSVGRAIETSAILSLDRITREIKVAESINMAQSTFDSGNGVITLNGETTEEVDYTSKVYMTNGIVKLDRDGVYQGALSASSTSVSNLMFRRIVTPNSEAIKIEMTISAGTGSFTQSKNFYSTAILKGSY